MHVRQLAKFPVLCFKFASALTKSVGGVFNNIDHLGNLILDWHKKIRIWHTYMAYVYIRIFRTVGVATFSQTEGFGVAKFCQPQPFRYQRG